MKLLITGIPGTGKTTIGNYLQEKQGYIHYDVEVMGFDLNDPNFIAFNINPSDDKVITWGFMPGVDDFRIQQLQDLDYTMIWFDGNRPAAKKAFIKRGTVSEAALNIQMARINDMDLSIFDPIQINTFNLRGNFIKEKYICTMILNAVENN